MDDKFRNEFAELIGFDSSYPVKCTDTLSSDLRWLHARLTHQIDREYELLNQRLVVLVTGNAFLFTSTAITLGPAGRTDVILKQTYIVPSLVLIFVALGIGISVVSLITMSAARDEVREKKKKRKSVEEIILRDIRKNGLLFPSPVTAPYNDTTHARGNYTFKVLPIGILFCWVFLFSVFTFSFSESYTKSIANKPSAVVQSPNKP